MSCLYESRVGSDGRMAEVPIMISDDVWIADGKDVQIDCQFCLGSDSCAIAYA